MQVDIQVVVAAGRLSACFAHMCIPGGTVVEYELVSVELILSVKEGDRQRIRVSGPVSAHLQQDYLLLPLEGQVRPFLHGRHAEDLFREVAVHHSHAQCGGRVDGHRQG